LKQGLTITLEGDILSAPYIKMTGEMMSYFGIEIQWKRNTINVKNQSYSVKDILIEGDWSAVAFLLESLSLSKSGTLIINGLFEDSWQGDYKAIEIYQKLGVESNFIDSSLHLSKKENTSINQPLDINLIDYPDLAQAYCCTLAGLRKIATLKGLQNLKHKESNRLFALKAELEKFQQKSEYTDSEFILKESEISMPTQNLDTHNDHRMAMCLAPLAILFDLKINDIEVVSKSYPTFWEDLKKMGFTVSVLTH
jgi:3-phosphoshikimate 1-carboxyvinyltransferase